MTSGRTPRIGNEHMMRIEAMEIGVVGPSKGVYWKTQTHVRIGFRSEPSNAYASHVHPPTQVSTGRNVSGNKCVEKKQSVRQYI